MHHQFSAWGHLGNDPEMKYTPNGIAVTNFNFATNVYDSETKGSRPMWIRVTAWRELAERCNQYLKKGSGVYLSGQFTPDESGNPRMWDDKSGNRRSTYEITARDVVFTDPRPEGENGTKEKSGTAQKQQQSKPKGDDW